MGYVVCVVREMTHKGPLVVELFHGVSFPTISMGYPYLFTKQMATLIYNLISLV